MLAMSFERVASPGRARIVELDSSWLVESCVGVISDFVHVDISFSTALAVVCTCTNSCLIITCLYWITLRRTENENGEKAFE